MTALIRWLVRRFIPGWHLVGPEEWELIDIMRRRWQPPIAVRPNSGQHYRKGGLVRNPVRKQKTLEEAYPVWADGELKMEGENE